MRVAPSSSVRAVALAVLLLAGLLVSGCATQAPAVAAHSIRHAVTRRAAVRATGITVLPDLTYGVADGVPLRLDICMPTPRPRAAVSFRPAVISIHGGSWMEGDKGEPQWRSVCEWLASAGYVVASVDYRLAPKYVYPDQLSDVERAVEWLRAPAEARRFGLDPTLIGAFGGSAGGNLAALLGTSGSGSHAAGHRIAAVAELSGPANLTASGPEQSFFVPRVLSYLGCASYATCPQAAAASPIDNVDSSDPPFFIAHSTDELIPLAQSVALVDRLRAARVPVTFVEVPGTLHSISMLNDSLRARIIDFFRSVLVHHAAASSRS